MKSALRIIAMASAVIHSYAATSAGSHTKTNTHGDLPQINVDDFEQKVTQAPIDHYNYQDDSEYDQRYWVNDKYFDREHGPVFLYICGEYTCSIREDRKFAFMVGASHRGLLLALEHRFYGKSQPFLDLATENMKYLTAEQALSDIASFLTKINSDKPDRKVIVVGGSYPGALSAWFRQRYPHIAMASWSSSGVVYPIADFWKFDEQVYLSTVKSGAWCPAVIQELFAQVESTLLGDQVKRSALMKRMGAAPEMNNGDFAFFFADIFVESVQYGNRTGLCSLLGQIKDKDFDEQLDAIAAQAKSAGAEPQDYCRNALKNTTITDSSARAWTYQYCTEFGWYQVPSKVHPMRSIKLLNMTYWQDYCNEIYGLKLNIERSITEFAFHHTAGSNTIITNGGEDPWQWATELHPNREINQRGLTADCDDCGHCADLYTPKDSDKKELVQVREAIIKWIEEMLRGPGEEQTNDVEPPMADSSTQTEDIGSFAPGLVPII